MKTNLAFEEIEKYFRKTIEVQLKTQKGKIVAIDPANKKYFIGNDIVDAYEKASVAKPNIKPFYFRIGYKSTHFVG